MKRLLEENWFRIIIATCFFMIAYSIAFYFVVMALNNQKVDIQKTEIQQGGQIKEWHMPLETQTFSI